MEQGLSDASTPETREAWAKVYGVLAGAIKGDANAAPQRSGYTAAVKEEQVENARRDGRAQEG